MSLVFRAETYGKWILAGEHAVLRGSPALVFPLRDYVMKFSYEAAQTPLQIHFEGTYGADLRLVLWGVMEQALEKLGRSRSELKGFLKVNSQLPLGAGLGASAALCVGLCRLFISLGWLDESQLRSFARDLEGIFHGESSGVDIAVAVEQRGLKFVRGGDCAPVDIKWAPKLFLSFSGERGATSDCVRRVNELRSISPFLGEQLDQEMRKSVQWAEEALSMEPISGYSHLQKAITQAKNCFVQWGLTTGALDFHMAELERSGAVAVKPTGSGGGGYVLSLWAESPNPEIQHKLVPLF